MVMLIAMFIGTVLVKREKLRVVCNLRLHYNFILDDSC